MLERSDRILREKEKMRCYRSFQSLQPDSKTNMKNTIIIFVIIAVIVGGGAFYGGRQYGKGRAASSASQARQQRSDGQGGQFNRADRARVNFINGNIITHDDKSITVKLTNGGSKIIFLSNSTQISKFTAGGPSDLIVGQTVSVNGTTNSDGSLSAQMIQLRPSQAKNASSTQSIR